MKLSPEPDRAGLAASRNKIWNAVALRARCNLEGDPTSTARPRRAPNALEDQAGSSRASCARPRTRVEVRSRDYRFNDAATTLYRFVWNDFCDWYLEIAKSRFSEGESDSARAVRGTLARVLRDALALLHPFTPFQTEVLWTALHEALDETPESMLVTASWPTAEGLQVDEAAEAEMELVQSMVHGVRAIRALTTLGDRKPLDAVVSVPTPELGETLRSHEASIRGLAFLAGFTIEENAKRPPASAVAVANGAEIFIPLGEDVDLDKLKTTLAGRVDKLKKGIGGVEGKLGNENFVARADADVVQAERDRLVEMQRELELLERNLVGLG